MMLLALRVSAAFHYALVRVPLQNEKNRPHKYMDK